MLRRRSLTSQFECPVYPAALTHPKLDVLRSAVGMPGGRLSLEIRCNRYSDVGALSCGHAIGRRAWDFSRRGSRSVRRRCALGVTGPPEKPADLLDEIKTARS